MDSPRRSRVLPAALGAAIVLTAVAQAVAFVAVEPPPDGPILLRVRVQEGDTFTYRMDMSMDGQASAGFFTQPIEMTAVMIQDWRVEEVDASGIAEIEVATRLEDASLSGGELPPSQVEELERPRRIRIAPDGTIVEVEPAPALGGLTGVPGLEGLGPALPEDAVEPGDEWRTRWEQPIIGDAAIVVAAEHAFEGYERVDGEHAAAIRTTARMPLDFTVTGEDLAELSPAVGGPPPIEAEGIRATYEGRATMEGRQVIDPVTGLQLRSDTSGRIDMSFTVSGVGGEGAQGPATRIEMDLEIRMERL